MQTDQQCSLRESKKEIELLLATMAMKISQNIIVR